MAGATSARDGSYRDPLACGERSVGPNADGELCGHLKIIWAPARSFPKWPIGRVLIAEGFGDEVAHAACLDLCASVPTLCVDSLAP